MAQTTFKIAVSCTTCKSFFKVATSLSGKQVTCSKCRRTFIATEASHKKNHGVEDDFFLCKIALNYGLVQENQLEKVFKVYARQGHGADIEQLLVTHGGLSEDNLDLLKGIRKNWDLRQAEKQLAADAVERKFISEDQAVKALADQARIYGKTRTIRLLCDILMDRGVLTQDQCRRLLSAQGTARLLPDNKAVGTVSPGSPVEQRPRPFPTPENRTPEMRDTDKPCAPIHAKAEEKTSVEVPAAQTPQRQDTPRPVMRETKTGEGRTPERNEPSGSKTEESRPEIQTAREPLFQANEKFAPPQEEKPHPILDDAPIPSEPEEPGRSTDSGLADQGSGDHDDEDLSFLESFGKALAINGLELIISEDGLMATLRIPKDMDPSSLTVEDIKSSLREMDIVYGIVDEALIRGFLNSKVFREKPFKIAEGKAPVKGRDGSVAFFFDTDYLKIGQVSESGSIDFKDRGEIPFVTQGTILAEITPAMAGKNGKDIFGRDLLVQEVKSVFLKCEHGAQLSEDGRKAVATVSGQPKLSFGNRLHVLTEIVIPGDVGFETGHVDFEGNVTIKGSVQNDFHVKGANITAEEILAAHIVARGDLVVKTGITGAILDVEGDIKAKFINKSTIRCYGNVFAEKEIIDCQIQTSGACASRGKIVSSAISAKQGIEAMDIGTEVSMPCHLKIGVDDHINHEISLIDDEITAQQDILAGFENRLKNLGEEEKDIHKIIAGLAHVQDRSQLERKELVKNLEQLREAGDQDRIKEIELKIEELSRKATQADEDINSCFDRQDSIESLIKQAREQVWNCKEQIMGLKNQKNDKLAWAEKISTKAYIKTKGPVYSGTSITGKYSARTLRETMRAVRIHEAIAPDAPEGWEIKLA